MSFTSLRPPPPQMYTSVPLTQLKSLQLPKMYTPVSVTQLKSLQLPNMYTSVPVTQLKSLQPPIPKVYNSVYVVLEYNSVLTCKNITNPIKIPTVICVCCSYATAIQKTVQAANRTIIGPIMISYEP